MAGTSYLSGVKAQMEQLFAAAFDALSPAAQDDEVLAAEMKTLSRKTWELIEGACKTSFKNGKAAAGSKEEPDGTEKPKHTNPFRKE